MRSKHLFGCEWRLCALALGLFAIAGPPVRASVVLQTGAGVSFQTVNAIDSVNSTQTHSPSNPLPYNDTVTASTMHTSSTINTSLTQSLFNYGFLQSTTDAFPFANGNIKATFSVTTNTPYTLSGSYTMTSNAVANDFPESDLMAQLTDSTTSSTLFFQSASSFNSSATLTLGQGPFTGSLTGTLLANHTFILTGDETMSFGGDPMASGNGSLSLAFDGVASPVPLPAAGWAGGVGLLCLAMLMRKRVVSEVGR